MFNQAFQGKSVFVTGHTGFKGSWLSLWLEKLGAQVTGYALAPPTNPCHFDQARVIDSLVGQHIADLRETDRLASAIDQAQPDIILHLAAQTVVRTGYQDPIETFSTNVMGTAHVLEAIRLRAVPVTAVLVTSDKCYENQEQVWGYRECDPMGEHDPYGGSKGAAELVIRSYRDSFFHPSKLASHRIKVASVRAGNVIGGGDWTEHALIVDMVKALSNDLPIRIRSPYAFRPWQHVLQALHGYLTLTQRLLESDDPSYCSGWNIGPTPGNEISVQQVVELFLAEWGSGQWVNESDPNAPREAGILRLSIDKAIWNLGWRPVWDTRRSIQETAAWYKQWLANPESARELSLSQISRFEADVLGATR